MSELTEKEIRRRLPYPIAAAWHRVGLAQTDEERAIRLTACDEVIKRTLVAFLLPDYLRGPAIPAVEQEIAKLTRPSGGDWMALVRELVRYLGVRTDPPPFMPDAYTWFYSRKGSTSSAAQQWDSLVRARNDIVHGNAMATREMAKKEVGAFYKTLRNTLLSMSWLQGYRPLRVLSSEPTRHSRFEGNVQFFVGSEEWPEALPGEWDVFLPRDTVYLTNPSGTALLDIVPFLQVHPDPASTNEHLYLIKEAPGMKQVVRVHDDSGSSIRKAVRSNDGQEISFERWLAERPPSGGHQVLRSTGGGIFRFEPEVIATRAADGDLGPRFQVLGTLGRGGMAIVYRARDVELEEDVALKVLNVDLSQDPVYRERFRREARNMSRVHHPCIVPVTDVGALGNGQLFLKMPVLTHGSLQEEIRAGGGPLKERIVRWTQNALEALACIHRAGIVHRDVKPSNFLLSDDDRALLTDFGVALTTDDRRLTRTLEQMGTLAYMAPEQRTDRTVTGKADIYGLAVVLHELTTGSLPVLFPGSGLNGRFGELIREMGAMKPEDRPTAEEALKRLQEIALDPEPLFVPPSEPVIELRSPKSRRGKGPKPPVVEEMPPSEVPVTPTRKTPTRRPTPKNRLTPPPILDPVLELPPAPVVPRPDHHLNVRRKKIFAIAVLAALFAFNFVETRTETLWRDTHPAGAVLEQTLGSASQWFEAGFDFEGHDGAGAVAENVSSLAYFILFPLLGVIALVTCARRRDPNAMLLLATAAAVDYALTLPFYLFFPVPERWTFADSGAILLSDRVSSTLIQAFRPFSGLNNCFPSFHVSATVILIVVLFRARFLFRRAAALVGMAVALSTLLLGIHWLSDIIAGAATGVLSLYVAERVLAAVSAISWLNRVPEAG
jgi:serine/threonine protein kinase